MTARIQADDESGSWKATRQRQHLDFQSLSFRRKLEALDEMCELSRRFLEQRRRLGLPYIDPVTGEVVNPPGR